MRNQKTTDSNTGRQPAEQKAHRTPGEPVPATEDHRPSFDVAQEIDGIRIRLHTPTQREQAESVFGRGRLTYADLMDMGFNVIMYDEVKPRKCK